MENPNVLDSLRPQVWLTPVVGAEKSHLFRSDGKGRAVSQCGKNVAEKLLRDIPWLRKCETCNKTSSSTRFDGCC